MRSLIIDPLVGGLHLRIDRDRRHYCPSHSVPGNTASDDTNRCATCSPLLSSSSSVRESTLHSMESAAGAGERLIPRSQSRANRCPARPLVSSPIAHRLCLPLRGSRRLAQFTTRLSPTVASHVATARVLVPSLEHRQTKQHPLSERQQDIKLGEH